MLLTVSALLEQRRARASEEEIKRSLAGNLCRCTGYRGILEAVAELAAAMTTTVPETPRRRSAARTPRRDAREKLRGAGAVRRRHASCRACCTGRCCAARSRTARIVSIDTSAAEKMPGVVCVLTGADLADIDPYYGHAIKDRPIVAIDKVRFHGEQVAAVAAETPATAAAAVEAIEVEYEELPVVGDVQTAVAAGRAARHRPRDRRRASSTASASSRRATGTSATATASTAASSRRSSRARTSSSRASTRSRPSTSTRWRRTR